MRFILIWLAALLLALPAQAETPDDAQRFREEYLAFNRTLASDQIHMQPTVDLPDGIQVRYLAADEILPTLADGSGVLYLGFPECPWCRTLLPCLFEAAQAAGYVDPVLYCNLQPERNQLSLSEDGKIVVENPGSETYQALITALSDWLPAYDGLNDPSIRRIYFPTLFFFRNGKIQSVYSGTVTSQTDPYQPLSQEQYSELLQALTAAFQAIIH